MTGTRAGASQHSELVEQVLSGERPELQRLAASGMLPLPPTELVWLQVVLAEGGGGEIAEQASESLSGMEPPELAELIREGLDIAALPWLCQNLEHPLVLEAAMRRRDVPRSLLEFLASRLNAELQEILLLRQDAIVELPEILDALEANPELSSFSKRKISEYRRHLLRPEPDEAPAAEEVVKDEVDEISEAEVEEAIREARSEPAVGEVDEITGLSESQLRTLPLPIRLKLSRRAPRALRSILIRDNSPSVAVSVLENNRMSESEIEQIARSRSVVEDVLAAIARNRTWMRKYPIALALVKNPRTQVGVAIRLCSRLSVRDLRSIGRDRNVAHAVRTACQRLYKLKLT